MITIQYSDLRQALTNRSAEMKWYLDLKSGKLTLYSEDVDLGGGEAFADQLDMFPDRYIVLEPIPAKDRYRFVVDFIDEVSDGRARTDIASAITQSQPFKHFKRAIDTRPKVKKEWIAYEAKRNGQYVVDFLKTTHDVDATIQY